MAPGNALRKIFVGGFTLVGLFFSLQGRAEIQNEWLALVVVDNESGELSAFANLSDKIVESKPILVLAPEEVKNLGYAFGEKSSGSKIPGEQKFAWIWLRFLSSVTKQEQINVLEGLLKSSVVSFEPNQKVKKLGTPVDSEFSKQWWIQNTGQIDPPMPGQTNPPAGIPGADINILPLWEREIFGNLPNGDSVLVAVIDTGIDPAHSDLAHAVYQNPGETGSLAHNKKDDDGNGKVDDYSGWNFIRNNNRPFDDDAHGTHVSGIIAAKHNAVGIAGVAPGVKILPVKFLDANGGGTLQGAIEAIDYASKMGAKVLNNSWGGVDYSKALEDVIKLAGSRGSLFVAAAGNDGKDIDVSPVYPASYNLPNVLSVAATTSRDRFAFFSNTGAKGVHVAAPGFHIYSSVPGNKWEYMSGTSMACPIVVGIAALIYSRFPELNLENVKKRIIQSSEILPNLRARTQSWGRIDATRAIFGPFNGQPNPDLLPWQEKPYLLESAHPYLPNTSQRFRIEIPGAKAIKIHMKEHWVEESFDFLRLLDADGNEIQDFYGTKRDVWSKPVRSSVVYIELTSDDSNEKYGFAIDKISVAYSEDW